MEQNNTNHFLGINWTVRFKNPQFWLAIALSILVPPLAYTGTEFNEVTSWGKFFDILGDGFANPYIVLMMLVGIYNAVVDKTTKGFGDSYIAKQYLKPRTDYDPKQALDWQINVEKKAKAREQARKEQDEKLKLEEYERNNQVKHQEEVRRDQTDFAKYQEKGFETEQWNDDFAEEAEVEEGLRDIEDDDIIVDNFNSDINNSGVMLDTNQQVEGVIENGENTNTDK